MIISVIQHLKNKDKRGNIYLPELTTDILKCVWDLIEQIHVQGRKLPPEIITDTKERLKVELELMKQNQSILKSTVTSLEGLSKEELDQLTAPFSWDEISNI